MSQSLSTPEPTGLAQPALGRPGMGVDNGSNQRMTDEKVADSDRLAIGVVLFIALAMRVLLGLLGPWSDPSLALSPDTVTMETLGLNAWQEKAFAWPTPPTEGLDAETQQVRQALGQLPTVGVDNQPLESLRVPGFAILLGLQAMLGLPPSVLLVTQGLLGALCAPMAYFAARQLFPTCRVGAWVAGLAMALHPAALASAGLLVPATTGVFCFTLALSLAVQTQWKRHDACLIGGMAMGIGCLFFPFPWLALAAVPAIMVCKSFDKDNLRLAVTFAICSAVVPLGWAYRNVENGNGFVLSNGPLVAAYYEPPVRHPADGSVDPVVAEQHIKNQTSRWFDATQGRESDNAWAVMADTLSQQQSDLGWKNRLSQLSMRLFHNMTGEHAGQAAGLLGLNHPENTANRDLLSVAHRNAEMPAYQHHFGTFWILINGTLMALCAVGAVFLALRGQGVLALALGCLVLTTIWGHHIAGNDPFGMLLLATQSLLVASACSPPPRPTRRKKKRRKGQAAPLGPEFNVYGQPTRFFADSQNHDDDDETPDTETVLQKNARFAFKPEGTSDKAPELDEPPVPVTSFGPKPVAKPIGFARPAPAADAANTTDSHDAAPKPKQAPAAEPVENTSTETEAKAPSPGKPSKPDTAAAPAHPTASFASSSTPPSAAADSPPSRPAGLFAKPVETPASDDR